MSRPAERNLRCPQSSFETVIGHISVPQAYIHYRTQCTSFIYRKCPCIKLDLAYQVGIKYAHRPTRSPLRCKMIDIRNLYPIHIKTIFRRRTSANNQIISISYRRKRDTRIRAHYTGYIPIATRTFLDFPQTDNLQTYGIGL